MPMAPPRPLLVMVKLPDPERCPRCNKVARVKETRKGEGCKRRRRRCSTCKYAWSTYETIVHPRRLTLPVASR